MATMLHYPRNRHVTITIHVAYPTTAAGVTPAWMDQVCRGGCEDHNLRLEEGSLSRWFNVPRPNIINYTQLLLEGKAIYIGSSGAVPRAELDELIQWAGGRVVPLRSATHLLNFAVRRARTGHAEPVPRV